MNSEEKTKYKSPSVLEILYSSGAPGQVFFGLQPNHNQHCEIY